MGSNADAAPRSVTSPSTSVKRTRVLGAMRFPTRTPIEAPDIIATTLIIVPIPGNIRAGYALVISYARQNLS
jgi:hypothetical protein